jgi:hypothetical protein
MRPRTWAAPLYEMLRELERGAPFAETLERYARLRPLAPFIREMGGAELRPARPVPTDVVRKAFGPASLTHSRLIGGTR